jgi:transposase, IS5 family
MPAGKRKALNIGNETGALVAKAEELRAVIRAKVEHALGVIKRQFGYVKVHHRSLQKNTQQLITLFALSNLWMDGGKLMRAGE